MPYQARLQLKKMELRYLGGAYTFEFAGHTPTGVVDGNKMEQELTLKLFGHLGDVPSDLSCVSGQVQMYDVTITPVEKLSEE